MMRTAGQLAGLVLEYLASKDFEHLRELFDDDGAWELAFPLDGVEGEQQTVRGKQVIARFHRLLMGGIEQVEFFDVDIHDVSDELAFAQFRSRALTVKGQPYGNRYVARCDSRDGKIQHWLEFFDPRPAELVRADLAETLAARDPA